MKRLLLGLLFLGTSSPAFSKLQLKQEWLICKEHKDCIVAGHGCSETYAINKKFKNEFYRLLPASTFECVNPISEFEAICKNLICNLK